MSIRPIDLQTNMSQLSEVGKNEQAKSEAAIIQQNVLDKEAGEKSQLVNTKLDEAKKGDSAVIKDQQKKEEKHGAENGRHNTKEKKSKKKERSKDERMGNFIDILK